MNYMIIKSKSQEKAKKSFSYQCRIASNCRHEKYISSCAGCPEYKICDIQKRIEIARIKM